VIIIYRELCRTVRNILFADLVNGCSTPTQNCTHRHCIVTQSPVSHDDHNSHRTMMEQRKSSPILDISVGTQGWRGSLAVSLHVTKATTLLHCFLCTCVLSLVTDTLQSLQ